MIRKTPLRPRSLSKKPRMWSCAHCRVKNESKCRRCVSCGIGRATKRRSLSTRCDTLWAQLVKAGGRCEAGLRGNREVGLLLCSGALEAAHVVPRRHRSVRWDPANGRALCRAHHAFFTVNEKQWRDWIGPEWDRLWVKAQERWDGAFPIAELRAALNARKEVAA